MSNEQIQKHLNTTFKVKLQSFSFLFEEFTDAQRLELVKSIIWTAPSNHRMLELVKKVINSSRFESTID